MRLQFSLILAVLALGCDASYVDTALQSRTPSEVLANDPGERAYFNEYSAFVVGPAYQYNPDYLEQLAIDSIDVSEFRISLALENFDSERVAQALIRAHNRGVEVRVVADTDRVEQTGFQRLREADIKIVEGDGAILWSAEFGKDPVIRSGEDNRMVHNFLVFDDLRLLVSTQGFEGDNPSPVQFGFAMNSEDLAKDFQDSFDQLYGGVFSTEMTFFSDSVSSDSNRRTFYPTLDGTIELYFGPQEPVVKEIIDSVYAARSDVWVSSPVLRNQDLLSALRYKHASGFDVRILTAEPLPRDWTGIFDAQIRTTINQTLVIIDGDYASKLPGYARGKAFVSTIPLLQSVPFFRPNGDPNANPVAQASDHFIDGSLIGVHQIDPAIEDHFISLKQVFERLYDEN
jgi:phosphatidylserine/phosphatidylglycerophosphate/cardiolipin synthase-like enzyme